MKAKAPKKAKKNLGGRPPLPPEERSARRITVRLLPRDDERLQALVSKLGLSEGEIMRMALEALAELELKKPR